jgi:hypothetical protein
VLYLGKLKNGNDDGIGTGKERRTVWDFLRRK